MSHEQRLLKYATYISNCSAEALIYGKCVAEKAENITKSACEKEFLLLLSCFKKQVKRYKRAKRLVSIFRNNFGFKSPFRVLIDGTFAMAALTNKINLREQLPKYLCEEVIICVTPCVLAELEKLGRKFYGALYICRQFQVEQCPHKPARSPSACFCRLARQMKNKKKYFIATQDPVLTEKLRGIPGVPILFIKYKGILIDRASESTMEAVNESKTDLDSVKAIKKDVFGDMQKIKKKKRVKGPNPLSIKKKKKKTVVASVRTDTKTANGKRRRRKRKASEVDDAKLQDEK